MDNSFIGRVRRAVPTGAAAMYANRAAIALIERERSELYEDPTQAQPVREFSGMPVLPRDDLPDGVFEFTFADADPARVSISTTNLQSTDTKHPVGE